MKKNWWGRTKSNGDPSARLGGFVPKLDFYFSTEKRFYNNELTALSCHRSSLKFA